jgi:broad specificity phosphatase PhoE
VTLVHLVRHGRATAGWDVDPDPGIDELGREQAAAAADRLASRGPLDVVSSPLRRCRETAALYAARTGSAVRVAPAVAEIPSPDGVVMADRVEWLRAAIEGTWADLDGRYAHYRDGVVDFVRSLTAPTVVFSHFVAINAVIGACLHDDRVVIRRLDNGSVTTVRVGVDPPHLELVDAGAEADTLVR